MSTLTPASRREEATDAAAWEGIVNGGLTLIPSMGAVYAAMQNPAFMKRTNWQSRTAMAIMPALFVFTLTAERKHNHKMREIAEESSHAQRTVQWAEKQQRNNSSSLADREKEHQLTQLYKQSVLESGVRVVPGNQLSFHHVAANYAASHPIKVLAAVAVPSVAWIFYGRTGKQHLNLSFMILHTRVFGQFATLSLLLGVMGFKEWMDSHGRYITEADADARVEEMKQVRLKLLERLDVEHENEMAYKRQIAQAHEEDVKSGITKSNKKRNKKAAEDVNNAINTVKE